MSFVSDEVMSLLLDVGRCPATGERLVLRDSSLQNASGTRSYSLVGGVPVLVNADRSLFEVAKIEPLAASTPVRRLRLSLRRRLTSNSISGENLRLAAEMLWQVDDPNTRRRVLVVGGGIVGFGMEELMRCSWLDVLETDVYIGPRTKVVCDGHDLPFIDESFDAVVVQAVLEHVVDPARVVSEVRRVLKSCGLIYSEVPFIQQVHEGAWDFTRWTMSGHRRMLRDFDEIAAGAVGGPGEALAWTLKYFLLSAIGRGAGLRFAVSAFATIVTLPLRWADRAMRRRPASLDAASGTYFLGTRRESPRTDREIVGDYRGGFGSIVR